MAIHQFTSSASTATTAIASSAPATNASAWKERFAWISGVCSGERVSLNRLIFWLFLWAWFLLLMFFRGSNANVAW
jgi:hypothetical protein